MRSHMPGPIGWHGCLEGKMTSERRGAGRLLGIKSRRLETAVPLRSPAVGIRRSATVAKLCDLRCREQHNGNEPWNRSRSARPGLGDQRREDQEGHRQPRVAGVHRAAGPETVGRSIRKTGFGWRLRLQARALPPMNRWVDTGVWSLALRRDSPPERSEGRRGSGGLQPPISGRC